jgi:hypothetical protein
LGKHPRWVKHPTIHGGTLPVERAAINMTILLRNIPTGLYFQRPGRWTGNADEGLDFKSPERARRFIANWRLRDVELACAFEDALYMTVVPFEGVTFRYP